MVSTGWWLHPVHASVSVHHGGSVVVWLLRGLMYAPAVCGSASSM